MEQARECGVYAVILAGGTGRGLWPLSREDRPKPFLDLFGDGPLIRHSLRRARRLVGSDRVLLVADRPVSRLLSESGSDAGDAVVVVEPFERGTAASLALAAAHVRRRDPEAVLVVLPSDQVVLGEDDLHRILVIAVAEARRKEALVSIGVRPRSPETVYGYIQAGRPLGRPHVGPEGGVSLSEVRSFAEQPDLGTAIRFLESGDFCWNTGMLASHVDTLFEAYRRCQPDLYRDMLSIQDAIGTKDEERVVSGVYSWIHPESIATAIMEKTEEIVLLTGEFGWHDPGSWDEVASLVAERRAFAGEVQEPGCVEVAGENSFIRKPGGKSVAVVGTSDLIVIDTPDALLVCRRGESHRIGEALDRLRREGLDKFL